MELSPQAVAAATFKTVKRGYDPDEVRAYLVEVSASLESSHQQATAMEARARAAIAKLQDVSQHTAMGTPIEEAQTISRTLLLAQRTADATVADAQREAESIAKRGQAEAELLAARAASDAAAATASAVEQADRLLRDAELEAQQTKTDAHRRAEADVRLLEQQRAALQHDIASLEAHVTTERERVRAAADALVQVADRIPSGLVPVAAPATTAVIALGSGAMSAQAEMWVEPLSDASMAEGAPLPDPTPADTRYPNIDGTSVDGTDVDGEDVDGTGIDGTGIDGTGIEEWSDDVTPPAGHEFDEAR